MTEITKVKNAYAVNFIPTWRSYVFDKICFFFEKKTLCLSVLSIFPKTCFVFSKSKNNVTFTYIAINLLVILLLPCSVKITVTDLFWIIKFKNYVLTNNFLWQSNLGLNFPHIFFFKQQVWFEILIKNYFLLI